ncbi:hypothetical protein CF326_g8101, partial [Tilletia indica]
EADPLRGQTTVRTRRGGSLLPGGPLMPAGTAIIITRWSSTAKVLDLLPQAGRMDRTFTLIQHSRRRSSTRPTLSAEDLSFFPLTHVISVAHVPNLCSIAQRSIGTETRDEDDQDGRSMCAELHDGWMSASAPDVFDWTTNPVLADESFLQAQRDEDDFQSRRRYFESDAEVDRRFLHGDQGHGNAYGHGQTAVYAGPRGGLMNAPDALAEHPCPVLREYGFVFRVRRPPGAS